MADLKDLYQEAILDHCRRPRNFREPERSNRRGEGFNPLCGDKLSVFLFVENGIIREIGFAGTGCAILIASASMMTERLKEKTEAEAKIAFDRFHQLITSSADAGQDLDGMGELAVFSTLRDYPVRVKCATLAWQAMLAALEKRPETTSTE
jgi:nitrogen fixation protein NifU and related proteins